MQMDLNGALFLKEFFFQLYHFHLKQQSKDLLSPLHQYMHQYIHIKSDLKFKLLNI